MHRTSSKNRSLKVQRETLRTLARGELGGVHGGDQSNGLFICKAVVVDAIELPDNPSMPQVRACPQFPIDRGTGVFDPPPELRRGF